MISVILSLAFAATSANVAADTPAKPAKPKKVCEKIEVTGSTVPKRVCRTVVVEPAKPKDEATQAATEKPAPGATN
ncbi:MAG: hypothetical protein LCH74_03305 [Proteobacteria bacterium]|nr:hypothetical protein [Pseudomonadota bacterium]